MLSWKRRDEMAKKKHESVEISFYRHIGVLLFKKIVLRCEELLHIKRGYRLTNYHPEKMTMEGIRNFYWQLAYNCTLHITSIVLSLLYFVIAFVGNIRIVPVNIIVLVMIVFNLYCIFLQRYTYLRMQEMLIKIEDLLEQQYRLKINKIDELEPIYVSKEMQEAVLELIDRVEGVFLKKNSCFIKDEDLDVLELMKRIHCNFDTKFRTISDRGTLNEISIDGGIDSINPCKRVSVIVSALKYLFDKRKYISEKKSVVVVTESDKGEDLYNAVFGNDSTELELLKIKLLRHVFMNKVQVE